MEILLLGTAAAEGWPAPWCRCESCETARRRGGPNLRSRSGALIDDDFKIDYCADTLLQMQRTGRCLADVRTLVFTHQHSDHLAPVELQWLQKPYTQTPPDEPIAVYGSEQVIAALREQCVEAVLQKFELHTLQPLQSITLNNGAELMPLPADHVVGTLLLRITRHGKTVFYGHDSGLYLPETLDALEAGPPLDAILLDSTLGKTNHPSRGHMTVTGVVSMVEELRNRGAITPQTRIVATHFSHNGGLLHEELTAFFAPHGIEVAFDGMTIALSEAG